MHKSKRPNQRHSKIYGSKKFKAAYREAMNIVINQKIEAMFQQFSGEPLFSTSHPVFPGNENAKCDFSVSPIASHPAIPHKPPQSP